MTPAAILDRCLHAWRDAATQRTDDAAATAVTDQLRAQAHEFFAHRDVDLSDPVQALAVVTAIDWLLTFQAQQRDVDADAVYAGMVMVMDNVQAVRHG